MAKNEKLIIRDLKRLQQPFGGGDLVSVKPIGVPVESLFNAADLERLHALLHGRVLVPNTDFMGEQRRTPNGVYRCSVVMSSDKKHRPRPGIGIQDEEGHDWLIYFKNGADPLKRFYFNDTRYPRKVSSVAQMNDHVDVESLFKAANALVIGYLDDMNIYELRRRELDMEVNYRTSAFWDEVQRVSDSSADAATRDCLAQFVHDNLHRNA